MKRLILIVLTAFALCTAVGGCIVHEHDDGHDHHYDEHHDEHHDER